MANDYFYFPSDRFAAAITIWKIQPDTDPPLEQPTAALRHENPVVRARRRGPWANWAEGRRVGPPDPPVA
jgi:hypothetical protein